MQPIPQPSSPANVAVQPEQPLRLDSMQLLRGHKTVEIEHGSQRYTLRVTKDDKLILTK